MFGLNMWVRPFGHGGMPTTPAEQAATNNGHLAPHLAGLPYSAAAPWMLLASRASAASMHAGKAPPSGMPPSAHAWSATSTTDPNSITNADKLLELHRKLLSPHHPYASSLTPTELRLAAEKYSNSFRPASGVNVHGDPEPGECGTSTASTIANYYPSAFIPPKRPRTDSKGSVSPARSSDRDTPSGDGRSKSCSPRGSLPSHTSPVPGERTPGSRTPGDASSTQEDRSHGPSPPSIHQPWLSPANSERRCFKLENGHVICPVCELELTPGEVAEHYSKEMEKLYTDAAKNSIEQQRKHAASLNNKESRYNCPRTSVNDLTISHVGNVRYQTFLKIRQNRHDRLRLKCRVRKRRHHDDLNSYDPDDKNATHNRSLDSSFDEHNQSAMTSGSSGVEAGEITVDVDTLDEADPNSPVPLKCSLCLSGYSKPITSTQCWHVFCENCWRKALNDKRLCPHCQAITSPSDLRKVSL